METKTVQSTENKLRYLNETKTKIKEAIVAQGQTIEDSDTFRSYVDKIKGIKTLTPIHDFTDIKIFDNFGKLTNDLAISTGHVEATNVIKNIDVGDYILAKIVDPSVLNSTSGTLGATIGIYEGEKDKAYHFKVVHKEIFEKANITTDSILGTSDVRNGKIFYTNGKKLIGSNRLYEYNTKDDMTKSTGHEEGDYAIIINRSVGPIEETYNYSALYFHGTGSPVDEISNLANQDGSTINFTADDSNGTVLTVTGSTSMTEQNESGTQYETKITFTCQQPGKPTIELPIQCSYSDMDGGLANPTLMISENYNQPQYFGYDSDYVLLKTPLRLANFKSIGGNYDKIVATLSMFFQGVTFQNQDAYIYLNNNWIKIDSNTETEKELKAKITSLEKELNGLKTSLNSISNTIDEISGETV